MVYTWYICDLFI